MYVYFKEYNFINLGVNKEIKNLTPFFKRLVKSHSNHSLIYKFIEENIFKNYEILNKNTKIFYNIYKLNFNGLKSK
jgi:hypothetical protein